MTEPHRLSDDPAADEELRALVRGAPPTRGMPPELRASLGAQVTAIAATPVAVVVAKGLSAWTWVGVAAVVVALGAGVWRAVSPRPVSRPNAPAQVSARRVGSTDVTPAVSPAVQPVPALLTASPRPPSRPVAAPSRPRVVEAPPAILAPVAEPAVTSLPASEPPVTGAPVTAARTSERRIAEHRLLDQARAALTAGRIDEALAYVAEHEREFADGAMVEERELIAVEAHSRAGRSDEARTRGARFLSRWPRSLYAARVRALVGPPVDFDMARDGPVHSPDGGP